MPGPITHLVVQQHLPAYLQDEESEGPQLAEILNRDPIGPYANFGSQGPDFLTFSVGEYEGGVGAIANFMFDVYEAIKPFVDFHDSIQQTVDEIEQAVLNKMPDDLQVLIGDIRDLVDQITTAATTAVTSTITSKADLFYPFFPRIQRGHPEKNWFWFDTLHYRKTGEFTSRMWSLAGRDEDLLRYVIGYGSHIGTDVVGHPFVNSLVGGPYRMHWHRHHLIENWIDADIRRDIGDLALTHAALHIGPDDNYRADAVSGSYYSRLCEFPGGTLPDKLKELLVESLRKTFTSPDDPKLLTPDDLDTAYQLWLNWFQYATSCGDAQRPAPVDRPGTAAQELLDDFISSLPPIAGPQIGGSFNLADFFEAALDFLDDVAQAVLAAVDWLIDHAHEIANLPVQTALELMRWLLYEIRVGVWTFYDTLRFNVMVLGGYFVPEPRDLDKAPWAQAFLDARFVGMTGGGQADFNTYPHKHDPNHGPLGPIEHHLRYPGTAMEHPHAEPAPTPFEGLRPSDVMLGTFDYDRYIDNLYEASGPYGPNEDFTHHVDSQSWTTPQLGSAVGFTARLLATRLQKLPNFNLDGDRGYGWLAWRADDPTNIETNNPVDADYVDS